MDSGTRLWKHRAVLVCLSHFLEEHEVLRMSHDRKINGVKQRDKNQTPSLRFRNSQWGSRRPWGQPSSLRPGPLGTECRSCPCLWRLPSRGRSTACWSDQWMVRHLYPSATQQWRNTEHTVSQNCLKATFLQLYLWKQTTSDVKNI